MFTGLLCYKCICWDTPSEKTGLWQLPIVSSVFNQPFKEEEIVVDRSSTGIKVHSSMYVCHGIQKQGQSLSRFTYKSDKNNYIKGALQSQSGIEKCTSFSEIPCCLLPNASVCSCDDNRLAIQASFTVAPSPITPFPYQPQNHHRNCTREKKKKTKESSSTVQTPARSDTSRRQRRRFPPCPPDHCRPWCPCAHSRNLSVLHSLYQGILSQWL